MDYEGYFDLIKAGRNEEAQIMKNQYVPDTLYKYFCLDSRTELNQMKLGDLKNGKIYLSDLKDFNDPFEGNFFIFDETKLAEKGWDNKQIEVYLAHIASLFKVGCLSSVGENNMPMWAYYANNHQGFCIEYKITEKQKQFIFPVAYEDERIYGNSIVTNMLNGMMKIVHNEFTFENMPEELRIDIMALVMSMTTKHSSWSHENEYRILNPFDNYFPLIPNKIFIGMRCDEENVKELINIGNRFDGCEVYKMQKPGNTTRFELLQN